MRFNFGDAPTQQRDFTLIPDGTLAWAIVTIRPVDYINGRVLRSGRENPENRYLDVELTIEQGPFARRKVWDRIGLEGSEEWVTFGFASVRHILEVGREITEYGGRDPRYQLDERAGEGCYLELNGLRCAVKIAIETGTGGYRDKNIVRAYLSPNPVSNTHQDFLKLVQGGNVAQPAQLPLPAPQPGWQQPQKQPPVATPGWKGGQSAGLPQRPGWAGPSTPKPTPAPAPAGSHPDPDVPF